VEYLGNVKVKVPPLLNVFVGCLSILFSALLAVLLGDILSSRICNLSANHDTASAFMQSQLGTHFCRLVILLFIYMSVTKIVKMPSVSCKLLSHFMNPGCLT
jgi:hypothetical protein